MDGPERTFGIPHGAEQSPDIAQAEFHAGPLQSVQEVNGGLVRIQGESGGSTRVERMTL